jgi:hypothetical protein
MCVLRLPRRRPKSFSAALLLYDLQRCRLLCWRSDAGGRHQPSQRRSVALRSDRTRQRARARCRCAAGHSCPPARAHLAMCSSFNCCAYRPNACICFGPTETCRSNAAHASTPCPRKRCATRRKCAPRRSRPPLAAQASDVARSAAHQKASRDASLANEQLEQQLSVLKSSCASLEAEVSAQRLLADSSSEAADDAAARAHASLTQNIALKKKMKDELPRLADALAKAQAERDGAVKQREADAVNHTVERNMMQSKLAGAAALVRAVTAHPCCSMYIADQLRCRARWAAAAAVRVSAPAAAAAAPCLPHARPAAASPQSSSSSSATSLSQPPRHRVCVPLGFLRS